MSTVICHNKNIPIFRCTMENGQISNLHETLDKDHLPIILQDNLNLQSVNKWLESRKIPENRDGLKLARKDFPKLENYHYMFSLSDQYWFSYKKADSWEKLNYFTNDFSESAGRVFFEPWTVEELKESPDLTTNGVLKKRWIRQNGKTRLIKAGSRKYHQEPISEILSTMTLRQLDIIPFVEYEFYIDGLQLCCICDNFINENTEFVPFDHIYYKEKRDEKNETVYQHTIKMAEKYGVADAKDYIDRMIVADHFICNTDRHLGNFGLIRNAETGKIEGFAPLFDCGSAFFSPKKTSELYPEHEKKLVQKYRDKLGRKKVQKDALLRLAREYPMIEEKEEKFIIKNIKRVYGELSNADKEKIKEMNDDDLLF